MAKLSFRIPCAKRKNVFDFVLGSRMALSKFGRGLGTDVALLYPLMAIRTIPTLIMLPKQSIITYWQ